VGLPVAVRRTDHDSIPLEIQFGEWVQPAEVTARLQARPEDFVRRYKLLWPMAAGKLVNH
jgi:hypothetical protein